MTAGESEERVFFVPEGRVRERVSGLFDDVKRRLEALLPGADIQHVGSTAVPGVLTKGDLDVQIRVTAEQFAPARQRLLEIYIVNAGGFAADDAISFEDYTTNPSLGVHLTVIDGSADVQCKFRDLLVRSAALRAEYDALKRRFDGLSMDRYRDAKAEFVQRVLASVAE
jgi:GrpB-like predicted nucleotidyltransferase (UPF0157 family)